MLVKNSKRKKAYVIFTREPVPGFTKTRLMPYYSAEKCAELHSCFLKDMSRWVKKIDADIIVAYTGGEPVFLKESFGNSAIYIAQHGSDLGQKMENAFSDVFSLGYESVVLTGTDIPELRADTITMALKMLCSYDIVLGPTNDGGYYLIGMSRLRHEAFNVKMYGTASVFEETMAALKKTGLSVGTVSKYNDIDEKEDVEGLLRRVRKDASIIGQHTKRFLRDNQTVSIIIPLYNELSTIKSMMDQLRPYKDEVEIIFVDGNSTDDTISVIGNEYRVVECEKGRGRQLNTGALASCGSVLFFLHCDSVLPENFLSEIRGIMMKNALGCFGLKFDSHNFFMFTNRIISNYRAMVRGLAFGDQGLFIDRELFFNEGMFPDMPIMEDYEFSLRMRKKGYRPAMTRSRIQASSRRYGKDTMSIVRMEMLMFWLRILYRMGEDPSGLKLMYKDIR